MTEIKTLKEIKYNKEELNENLNSQREIVVCGLGYFQAQEDLKQEIIKWIKEIQKAMDQSEEWYDKKPVNSCSGDVVIGGCEFSWGYPDYEDFSSAIKILKHVHNIKEEDLK